MRMLMATQRNSASASGRIAVGSLLSRAGYSGKPLAEKLGYRAGQRAAFIALPAELKELAEAVPFASVIRLKDWSGTLPSAGLGLIHAFTMQKSELDARLAALQAALAPDGTIWVSWPKKASKIPTDVTEDRVREAALKLDLVDVKVAAIDAIWSGLKLVIRRERRLRG
jgi:hypothetical protein